MSNTIETTRNVVLKNTPTVLRQYHFPHEERDARDILLEDIENPYDGDLDPVVWNRDGEVALRFLAVCIFREAIAALKMPIIPTGFRVSIIMTDQETGPMRKFELFAKHPDSTVVLAKDYANCVTI